MPTLILVKHSLSQTDPNVPSRQWNLSVEGVRRCLPLARHLADYQPDIILTSDEPKAIETGQIVAKQLALPRHIRQDLHEQERVTAPFYPTVEEFQAAVEHFFDSPDQLVFGEETADEASSRFARAVTDVLAQHPQQTVVIVTHGTVLSLFVSRLFGLDPYPFWEHLTLPSFVVLEHSPWQFQDVVVGVGARNSSPLQVILHTEKPADGLR